jgi:hypothetical protein
VSARLAVVYIDGERRGLMVTGGETMTRFVGCRASRQARVDEGVAGDEAKLQSFTAMLEVALIGGDEDDRAS